MITNNIVHYKSTTHETPIDMVDVSLTLTLAQWDLIQQYLVKEPQNIKEVDENLISIYGKSIFNGSPDVHMAALSPSDCKHIVLGQRMVGEGLWCVHCDKKIYEKETRNCEECSFFKQQPLSDLTTCEKENIEVAYNNRAYYKITEGTCFEEKTNA